MKSILKIFLSIFIFLYIHSIGNADNLDSLKRLLKNPNPKGKSEILKKIGIYYSYSNIDTALFYEMQLKNEVKSNKSKLTLAQYYELASKISEQQNDYTKTHIYYDSSIALYRQLKLNKELASELISYGIFLKNSAVFDKAFIQVMNAVQPLQKLNDSLGLARVYYTLYTIKNNMSYKSGQLEYLINALAYLNFKDPFGEAIIYNGFGAYFYNNKQYDEALAYYKKSDSIFRKLNYYSELTFTAQQLIEVNESLKNYSECERIIKDSKLFLEKHSDISSKVTFWLTVARFYLNRDNISSAEIYFKLLLERFETGSTYENKKNFYLLSVDFYKKKNDYKNALKYSELLGITKDSIFTEELSSKVKEIEFKKELEEKDNKIDYLEQKNKIAELENNKYFTNQVIILLILAVVIIVFSFLMILYNSKKKQNEKLNTLNLELQELNATKDRFFTIIAHDLRNPLGTTKALLEMLNTDYKELSEEEKVEILSELEKSSITVFELLQNLLLWANLQRNKFEIEKTSVNLYSLINRNVKLCEILAKNKKLEIVNNVDSSLNVSVDMNMLNTVIRNLLTNSIKFTLENGKIEFTANSENNMITFGITDNGVGMSEDKIKRLFRIDQNVTTPGTNNEQGTGLGLILCQDFVKINDGKIWVESELGKGTSFYIQLAKAQ